MIKVISTPENYTAICQKCGSKIQYELSDVKKDYYCNYVLTCPHCSAVVKHTIRTEEKQGE